MTKKRAGRHKGVEFVVEGYDGHQRTFKTFGEATDFAVGRAASTGSKVDVDVLIYSVSGARWWGGDPAVEEYQEDPEASVSDRFEVSVNHVGRVA
jgi:hypothetical protein